MLLLLAYHLSELWSQSTVNYFKNLFLIDFVNDSSFLRHFGQNTWWQIQIDRIYNLICQLLTCICIYQCFGQFLAVCLASTIVLYLDVEILATFRAKELAAAIIWADIGAIYFSCCTSEMLFSPIFRIRRW